MAELVEQDPDEQADRGDRAGDGIGPAGVAGGVEGNGCSARPAASRATIQRVQLSPTRTPAIRPRRTVSFMSPGYRHAGATSATRFHVGVTLGDGVALVVALAAPGQGQVDLGPAVLEVDRQGDQGEGILGGPPPELVDLAAVQQQLAGAVGVDRAEAVGVDVRRDVHPVEPDLAVGTRA